VAWQSSSEPSSDDSVPSSDIDPVLEVFAESSSVHVGVVDDCGRRDGVPGGVDVVEFSESSPVAVDSS
jgi:hypothetical protein